MTFQERLLEEYNNFQTKMGKMLEEECAHLVNTGIDEKTAEQVVAIQVANVMKQLGV